MLLNINHIPELYRHDFVTGQSNRATRHSYSRLKPKSTTEKLSKKCFMVAQQQYQVEGKLEDRFSVLDSHQLGCHLSKAILDTCLSALMNHIAGHFT